MENIPFYLRLAFILTTLITVLLFYRAAHNSKPTLLLLAVWLIGQAALGAAGFYTVTDAWPPRFLFVILPPFLFIIGLFSTGRGRAYLDQLDVKTLTILHTVRIAVELVLFGLFARQTVPQLMTFEGRNFDILAGLTAPLVFYFGFIKKKLNRTVILIWNFVCLGLLINIVVNAILSAPSPLQKFGFEQPNIAVLYFPFVWLPAGVVPLVLLAHLATIRRLLYQEKK